MNDVEININLPGWVQTVDETGRKEFQGDGCKLVLDTSGGSIDVTVKDTPALTVTDK